MVFIRFFSNDHEGRFHQLFHVVFLKKTSAKRAKQRRNLQPVEKRSDLALPAEKICESKLLHSSCGTWNDAREDTKNFVGQALLPVHPQLSRLRCPVVDIAAWRTSAGRSACATSRCPGFDDPPLRLSSRRSRRLRRTGRRQQKGRPAAGHRDVPARSRASQRSARSRRTA